jgi:serpin B
MSRYPQFLGLLAIGALSTMAACTTLIAPSPTDSVAPPPNAGSPAHDSKDVKTAAEGLTAFAADLYAQLRTENGNLIVSPYSIGSALALTAVGARGETYDQIQKVFRFPSLDKIGPIYGSLAAAIVAPPKNAKHKPELSTANSLWVQQGYGFRKDYLEQASNRFHAGIFDVDFIAHPDSASRRINAWVEKETRDRIKDLVSPDLFSYETRMVLANAVYFKAHWLDGFKERDTNPADFTLASGSKVKAPLMYQLGQFSLAETDRMQVLKLPYDGNATSLYVILPRVANQLPAIEKELSPDNLTKWTLGNERASDAKVWLPKFKYTVRTGLVPTLKKLGIEDAFIKTKASFKGMTDHPDGLYITDVIHKAFVEMDETGTEAAAATAVVFSLGATAAPPHLPPHLKEFKADHPFLFVIKHEATGALLFMGRVEDPTK